jgi:hypothetical protein
MRPTRSIRRNRESRSSGMWSKAAAMGRQGRSWDEIREFFGLQLSDADIARRLKKANYGWGGQRLEAESESG